MEKYSKLADDIIKNVGGKENIVGLQHCITRLRFNLKDESIANDDVLKNMDGVITVMKAMGPCLNMICASGIVKGLTTLLLFLGVVNQGDGLYLLLSAIGDGTFLPIVFMVAVAAPLERFLKKYIPEIVSNFIVPVIVLVIIVPIGFILIGPAANLVGV